MQMRRLVQLIALIAVIIAAGLIYLATIRVTSPPVIIATATATTTAAEPAGSTNSSSMGASEAKPDQNSAGQVLGTATSAQTKETSRPVTSVTNSKTQGGPIISINFDDDFESGYKYGVPVIHAAGYKTTQYIITHTGGSQADFAAQVKDLYTHGDEIGAHTQTHPRLTKIPLSFAQQEIDGSKSDLQAMGYAPVTFAYPYGDTNPAVEDLVKKAGFAGARSTNMGFNDHTTDPFMLLVFGISNSTTVSQVEHQIDEVEANKKWLIFVIHRVDEPAKQDNTTHQLLQQMVSYIASKKIPVVTNAEGLQIMKNIP